jgi:CheY-like chemotaxis protein
MSITDRIVQRMGGAIDVSSRLGSGTVVKVTLLVEFINPPPLKVPNTGNASSPAKTFNTEVVSADIWDSRRSYMDGPRSTKPKQSSHRDVPGSGYSPAHKSFQPTPSSNSLPGLKSTMVLPESPPLKEVIHKTSAPAIHYNGEVKRSNLDIKPRMVAQSPAPMEPPKPIVPLKLRVLVVDDNKIGRKILTTLLSRRKEDDAVTFQEAEDGCQAVSIFDEFRPHLVWTDVSMPIMDGIEAAKRMRGIEKQKDWPRSQIVAITGLSQNQTMEIFGEEGDEAGSAKRNIDEWLVCVSI